VEISQKEAEDIDASEARNIEKYSGGDDGGGLPAKGGKPK
jgi:hypothetical protein